MSSVSPALAASMLLLLAACSSPGPEGTPPGNGDPPPDHGPVQVQVPEAPSQVIATAGNRDALVIWTPPKNDGGAPIIGYQVRAEPDGATLSANADARRAIVPGLRNGTAYTFTVAALNSAGQGAASAPSNAVIPLGPPAAPTAVGATWGNGQTTVSWSPPADTGGSPVTGYTVTALPGGQTVRVGPDITEATFTGLINGTVYTFTVTADNEVGTGPASLPSSGVTPAAKPGAPTNVTLSPGNVSAILSWQAPVDTGGLALTGYSITVQPGGRVLTVAANTLTATVDALQPGTSTTFLVSAVNAAGASTPASVSFSPFGFKATASLARNASAFSVAAGDLDKNGTLDLVCIDYLAGLATTWLGKGDGTFPTSKDQFITGDLTEAVVADFNKDGNPDLAVAIQDDNSVSIRLGQGNGSFRVGSTPYSGGSGPRGLVTADFNADGNADLVTAHEYYQTGLSLLSGRGDGSFGTSSSILSGTVDTWALATADVDRDGKMDVVATTTRPGISVLRGKGDGTFEPEVSYPTSALGHDVVVADFNGDGAPDLAAPLQKSNTVAVLLNTGTGGFGQARTYATAVSRPESITAGDFNQDGYMDLAVAYLVSNYITLLFNRGDGTFYTAVHYNAEAATFVDAMDVNGDSKTDLVIGAYSTGVTSVWISF